MPIYEAMQGAENYTLYRDESRRYFIACFCGVETNRFASDIEAENAHNAHWSTNHAGKARPVPHQLSADTLSEVPHL